jgi:DNA polymerase/3'-5' exonuclease PolX
MSHDYAITPAPDGAWHVTKSDGTVYVVGLKKIRFGCKRLDDKPCPGFKFRGTCKHVEMVKSASGWREQTLSHKSPRPMAEMAALAETARKRIETAGGILRVATVAGSIRRGVKAEAGDIDIVAVERDAKIFDALGWEKVSGGENQVTYLYKGVQVNVKVTMAGNYGAALLHYTGSKQHNIKLRTLAKKRAWTLNEFALFDGPHLLASKTEEEIFAALGLGYVAPAEREI